VPLLYIDEEPVISSTKESPGTRNRGSCSPGSGVIPYASKMVTCVLFVLCVLCVLFVCILSVLCVLFVCILFVLFVLSVLFVSTYMRTLSIAA
jgi:hypothetical protein